MAKLGIMGGTFDPIHNGHLLLGRQAYEEYGLKEIWFMPSGTPPHKKDHEVTAVEDRLAMVCLAVQDFSYFICSDFEIQRQGNTYTAETLRLLRKKNPEHDFYFIVGADSLYQMENWYHPGEVMEQAVLLVADRVYEQAHCPIEEQIAFLKEHYDADIRLLHCKEVDIASAKLRERKAKGKNLTSYVPKAVEEYIEAHGLYQEEAKGWLP